MVKQFAEAVNGFTENSVAVGFTLVIAVAAVLVMPSAFRYFGWSKRLDDRRP